MSDNFKKPSFFIIGAPKCGTTSLYSWLREHNDIFMPEKKEPHYFAQHLSDRYCRIRNENEYLNLFKNAKDNQICGEASVLYGFYPDSIRSILKFNPEAKIIFMLRHPIDMIISYHGQLLVNLEEDEKFFEKAWGMQKNRANNSSIPSLSTDVGLLQYGKIGHLGEHLMTLIDIVPKGQLKIILLDDIANDVRATYIDVLDFLGKSDDGRTLFKKENEASAIKFQFLEKLKRSHNPVFKFIKNIVKKTPYLKNTVHINNTKRIDKKLNDTFLKELYSFFKDDIQYLENYFSKPIKTKYINKL